MLSIEIVVRQSTTLVKAGVFPFVEKQMRDKYGSGWERRASCQFIDGTANWDLQALLKTILDNWQDVFEQSLPRDAKGLIIELKNWRNRVAHEHTLTLEDTSRLLDTSVRFLRVINASQASEVNVLRLQVLKEELRDFEPPSHDLPVSKRTVDLEFARFSEVPLSAGRQIHIPGAPSWQSCVDRIGKKLDTSLTVKQGRCVFTGDGQYGICCLVSKEYAGNRFWWNFRNRQLQSLT